MYLPLHVYVCMYLSLYLFIYLSKSRFPCFTRLPLSLSPCSISHLKLNSFFIFSPTFIIDIPIASYRKYSYPMTKEVPTEAQHRKPWGTPPFPRITFPAVRFLPFKDQNRICLSPTLRNVAEEPSPSGPPAAT